MPNLKDNFSRNRNVRWVYTGLIIVATIAIYLSFDNSNYFETFSFFGSDLEVAEAKLKNFELVELLFVVMQILGFVLFLTWLYRSYENANQFEGNYTSTSPGWAIGGFFIPIYNLSAGYKAMRDTWNLHSEKSQEASLTENNPSLTPTSLVLPIIWWSLFIGTSVVSNIGQRIFEETDYLTSKPYTFHIVEHLLYIAYLSVAIVLLKKMDDMETETYARYHQRDLMEHLTAE